MSLVDPISLVYGVPVFSQVIVVGLLGLCVSCRCSTACLTQSMRGILALSLVGSIAIHCIPLPAGTVLVGHCGTFVVTVFSVLRTAQLVFPLRVVLCAVSCCNRVTVSL